MLGIRKIAILDVLTCFQSEATVLRSGHHDTLLKDRHTGSGSIRHDICLTLSDLRVGTRETHDTVGLT